VIEKLCMPKWGLNMTEAALVAWLVEEGAELSRGDEVAEAETEKINGIVESPAAGVLRRRVARAGEVIPVGGLLGVLAEPDVAETDIDAFVAEFQSTFVPEAVEEEAGPQTETIAVNGRSLRFLRQGEGEATVVLLHGFGGDLTTWLFNAEPLAAGGRSVFAFDLPGHGGSAKELDEGTVDELASALLAALDALGVGRAHLVGHSLGAAVAATMAAERPGLAASLVLIAPVGLGEDIDGEFIEGFVTAQTRRELRPVLERLFANPDVVTRQFTEEVLKTKRIDGVEDALSLIAAACFSGGRQAVRLDDVLGRLEVPVLAIWGESDRIVRPAHADSLPASARREKIAGAGHMPQMEASGEVNRIVDEFLRDA
jgi:pyruvate dehydrogenase E2 component (dihydrolipoamide acetyltransferase)